MAKQIAMKKGQETINVNAARQSYYETLGYVVVKPTMAEVPKEKKVPEVKAGGSQ